MRIELVHLLGRVTGKELSQLATYAGIGEAGIEAVPQTVEGFGRVAASVRRVPNNLAMHARLSHDSRKLRAKSVPAARFVPPKKQTKARYQAPAASIIAFQDRDGAGC